MKELSINHAPESVQKAFSEVRKHFPSIDRVSFDSMCRWCYTDSQNNIFSFLDKDIPQDVLEAAADDQYNIGVPVLYVLFKEKVLAKSEIPGKPTVTLTQIADNEFDVNCGIACVSFDNINEAINEFAFQVKSYQAGM